MNVSGNIGAKIALTGSEEGNNVLSTKLHTEFKNNRYGRPTFQKAVIDANGELRLRAIIDASLNTQILGWKKHYTVIPSQIGNLPQFKQQFWQPEKMENGQRMIPSTSACLVAESTKC